jgi:tetratricopeptide (TPR) repeat protein
MASLHKALDLLADTADPVDKAYIFTELCYGHLAKGQTSKAIRAAEDAQRLLGPVTALEYARATTALAVALTAAGQQERASALFTEAATVLDRLGATRHAARTWIELAHALADAGRLREAITAYDSAARAVNISDPRWRQRQGL